MVNLYANGKHIASTILNEENMWMHVFTHLDKYDSNGKTILYSVNEFRVPEGYVASYETKTEDIVFITNTYQSSNIIIVENHTLEQDDDIIVHVPEDDEKKDNITFDEHTELVHFKWGWELINMSKYFELYEQNLNDTGDSLNVLGNASNSPSIPNNPYTSNPYNNGYNRNDGNQGSYLQSGYSNNQISGYNRYNSYNYRYNRYNRYNWYSRNNYYNRNRQQSSGYSYQDEGKIYK
ncbi:Cna B-type domain-containing protein [Methanosphaera sp. ISO3-F5]|uniref:Cna B-type domain-containing protein n=1 Tax=Methanosphaera sp. ISO3-F5 TaxID=1452353 RepID=UPI002B261D85|nr:Cna B-type domain-containing protein [Methanosphaera sp. ISO3-F5]WQH63616.1 Cna B-type domain-containing protein [Methanosphaera sp. ISO3-F5]